VCVRARDGHAAGLLRCGLALDRFRIRGRERDAALLVGKRDRAVTLILGLLLCDGRLAIELRDLHCGVALGRLHADLARTVRVGDGDLLLLRCRCDRDLAELLLHGDIAARLLHRARASLAADRLDVARFVVEVLDVHVDQLEADLLQLGLQRVLDVRTELVAIAIDVLDLHRCNDLSHLTEDDVHCQIADLPGRQPEHARGRVLLKLLGVADRDRHLARHAHADVLERERVGQVDVDLKRQQRQEIGLLDDGPDERAAAADHARGLTRADLAGDYQHTVRWAAPVSCDEERRDAEQDQRDRCDHGEPGREWRRLENGERGHSHASIPSMSGVGTTSTVSPSITEVTITDVPVGMTASSSATARSSTVRPCSLTWTTPNPARCAGTGR
jgi:hypothetical protein